MRRILGPIALAATLTLIPGDRQKSAHPSPRWELRKGERTFRVNGTPTFVIGRNPTERSVEAFETHFREAAASGESLVRLHLMHGIPPNGAAGKVDEAWAAQWDRVFDSAARHGIAVIPVFALWAQWNDGSKGELWHVWRDNPYNRSRGGPASSPAELFGDTECRRLWLDWLTALVRRWQSRPNIVAWEPFSELDLLTGASPAAAAEFVRYASKAIREADPARRPITVSLSGMVDWPEVFGSAAVDIVQAHPYANLPPYAGNLSDNILDAARTRLRRYAKPVLLGECGLDFRPPANTLTVAERAGIGIRHAIWASAVSGAMAGRMLWWEDGYDKYEQGVVAGRYRDAAAPTARFVRGVSYAGLAPTMVQCSANLRGAALSRKGLTLAWFRDAKCGPPDWLVREVSGETVSLAAPGKAARWEVRFYDTATGSPTSSKHLTASQGRLSVPLPKFRDSIAFIVRPTGLP